MKLSRITLALAAGLTLAGWESRAQATWAGNEINFQLLSPNLETVAFNSNYIVPRDGNIRIDPFNGEVPINFFISGGGFTLEQSVNSSIVFRDFSLIKVTDNTARIIENVQVNPNSNLTLRSSLISGNNFFQFNLQELDYRDSANSYLLNLDIGFRDVGSPMNVPAPASLPVLAVGLTALASIRFAARGGRAT